MSEHQKPTKLQIINRSIEPDAPTLGIITEITKKGSHRNPLTDMRLGFGVIPPRSLVTVNETNQIVIPFIKHVNFPDAAHNPLTYEVLNGAYTTTRSHGEESLSWRTTNIRDLVQRLPLDIGILTDVMIHIGNKKVNDRLALIARSMDIDLEAVMEALRSR